MPKAPKVMKSRLKALMKQYGNTKGQDIYDKMEAEGKNGSKARTKKSNPKKVFK